jgi:hypothetical protein
MTKKNVGLSTTENLKVWLVLGTGDTVEFTGHLCLRGDAPARTPDRKLVPLASVSVGKQVEVYQNEAWVPVTVTKPPRVVTIEVTVETFEEDDYDLEGMFDKEEPAVWAEFVERVVGTSVSKNKKG